MTVFFGQSGFTGEMMRKKHPLKNKLFSTGAGLLYMAGRPTGGLCVYISRRPSRARVSVASSANSRCPPTGMP